MKRYKALIAGIGGASLGTEILKSLLLADRYEIFGCDISKFAYGHYQKGFKDTFVIDRNNYIDSILKICKKLDINCIIPGGDEPTRLISDSSKIFEDENIQLAINSPEIIKTFSDKKICFKRLSELGFKVPLTTNIELTCSEGFEKLDRELDHMNFPCIIKPSTDSGGSYDTLVVNNKKEAILYIEYLNNNNRNNILIQEYISYILEKENEGEFTIGVLSLPNGDIATSVAMKRIFDSKLSVRSKGNYGIISSGYSQGLIDDFPELCKTAEDIAISIGSKGPINVQGRLRNGVFIPFEINPRFSASTYLRALAGVNEVDIFLQYLSTGTFDYVTFDNKPKNIRKGYYIRSFSETFVSKDAIKDVVK